ncbi:MAG: DUF433 domain-containing protein [Proteobacteria bacterium]|nr:DUF433 domain-containing protein [Pseudomonadota bacterium]
MNAPDLITVDLDILGGTPVFKGTRVPVNTLFEYLENNYTLDEFLECYPFVTREMACRLLRRSQSAAIGNPNFEVSTLEELETKLLIGLEHLAGARGFPARKVSGGRKRIFARHRAMPDHIKSK